MRRSAVMAALALLTVPLAAQSYRVQLSASGQAVTYRGLSRDSIRADSTVAAAGGGATTPDGHAVRCGAGTYCFFFRPGPVLASLPTVTSADVVAWGLGVPGLSIRASARALADFGADDAWPATEPAWQLLEGYAEYLRHAVSVRAGRQLVTSRLEPVGFDGAWARAGTSTPVEFTAYAGWGFGQATAVVAGSAALNPLDEWRARERQVIAGAEVALTTRRVVARTEYRREVDPEGRYFVSERAAGSLLAYVGPLRATGGVDYDVAADAIGSADGTLSWIRPRGSLSAGARRYRPYFSLWTLWGAFSPVPFNAVFGSASARVLPTLTLDARAERYRYEDAGISTAVVPGLTDRGWRMSAGATGTPRPEWTISANAGFEHGPGAASRFVDAAATYAITPRVDLGVFGGSLARPLELRYYDAASWWVGARANAMIGTWRAWGELVAVADDRDRPDPAASSMRQLRVRVGTALTFGTDADRMALPPGRPRTP